MVTFTESYSSLFELQDILEGRAFYYGYEIAEIREEVQLSPKSWINNIFDNKVPNEAFICLCHKLIDSPYNFDDIVIIQDKDIIQLQQEYPLLYQQLVKNFLNGYNHYYQVNKKK